MASSLEWAGNIWEVFSITFVFSFLNSSHSSSGMPDRITLFCSCLCSKKDIFCFNKIFSASNWVFLDSRFAMVFCDLSSLAGNEISLDRLDWTDFNSVMLESTFSLSYEWFLFMSFGSNCNSCSRLKPQSSLFNFSCGVLGGVALLFNFWIHFLWLGYALHLSF